LRRAANKGTLRPFRNADRFTTFKIFRLQKVAANSITFVFQDITNWKKGTEHINGLELFFKDRDHLIEKWEVLNPDGTKTHFEFQLVRNDK
jgi:hypothetical protein